MKLALVVLAAALTLECACKKKEASSPGKGSAGAGSQVAAAPTDGGAADAPEAAIAAALETDDVKADDDSDSSIPATFHNKVPRLPALNADGTMIASFGLPGGEPSIPNIASLVIAKFPSNQQVQELPIVNDSEAMAWPQAAKPWLTPAVKKTLETRGAAIMKRLEGFHSLTPVAVEEDNGQPKPAKIAGLTLESTGGRDEPLTVSLTTATGKLVHRETIDTYTSGNRGEAFENTPCEYGPMFGAAYRDPARPGALYIEVAYHWLEGCAMVPTTYIVWSLDPNSTTPGEVVADLVDKQFDLIKDTSSDITTADLLAMSNEDVTTFDHFSPPALPGNFGGHTDSAQTVTMSRDGKSAWASELTTLKISDLKHGDMPQDKRVSDVLVQTPKGWRIAAFAWTDPKPNAAVNRDAKAGNLSARKIALDAGDAGLRDAFAKVTTEGATNIAKDLVAIGSGPGEVTVGAPAFAKPWNVAWKGKMTIVSSVARVMPSGTTGWVAATIELQKTGYKIPFTVFAVFDKDASGAWTLVHIHFAA